MKVTASAPAKIILCGEHAVVFYEPAIVMAINRKAYVTVEERRDQAIYIKSRELGMSGQYEGRLFKPEAGGLKAKPKLDPIQMAVTKTLELTDARVGLNVSVNSDIPVAAGLGSSAAVAVATIAATAKLLGIKLKKEAICALAYEAEKLVHKHPSGVDNYISTYGGITIFRRSEKLIPFKVSANVLLVIGNTGISRSTGKLVGHVRKLKEAHPGVITTVLSAIGQLSVSTAQALQEGNLMRAGGLMNVNHGLLSALGVSNEALDHLVYAAREAGALGAKLTGAGGGGCIIALATPNKIRRVEEAIQKAGGTVMISKKIDRGVEAWKET